MTTLTQINTLRLSELTRHIADVVSGGFAAMQYWVVADISNHSFYPNKEHHYFEVVEKDDQGISITAKMQAVAWRPGAARIRQFETVTGQKFKAGIKVSLRVQVEYHATYGLKLVVTDVDPAFTLGQLELHRLATINKLLKDCPHLVQKAGDGFKTKNNSLSHKTVIQHIAVVSSSSSAGYQDFIHTLRNNAFGYTFSVRSYYTTVQGEVHAEAASKKIEAICASGIEYDAIVIIRGGGADTDFLIFDQFVLCEAVAKLHIPVITGLGHLKNQTLVDLMAHTSTNAPTKAAEFIIAHNHAFETGVLAEQQKIVIKAQQILARQRSGIQAQHATVGSRARAIVTHKKEAQEKLRQALVTGSRKLLYYQQATLTDVTNKVLNKPLRSLAQQETNLAHAAGNLKLLTGKYLESHEKSIAQYETMCRLMSPINILKKGFAIVYHQGTIATDGNGLKAGSDIKVRLIDSELNASITSKQQTHGDTFNL